MFEFMDYARMIVIFIRIKTIVCDEELFHNNKVPDAKQNAKFRENVTVDSVPFQLKLRSTFRQIFAIDLV